MVEAHGTFMRSYCTSCKKGYDLPWLKAEIFSPGRNDGVPKCDSCRGVVRPDVVLFGEALPDRCRGRGGTSVSKHELCKGFVKISLPIPTYKSNLELLTMTISIFFF